jgi:hypothetical protein
LRKAPKIYQVSVKIDSISKIKIKNGSKGRFLT